MTTWMTLYLTLYIESEYMGLQERGLSNSDVLELGEIEKPLMFFGGPCSNLQSTEALLTLAAREGFSPERIICTGDLVAYCADPAATVDRIRDSGVHVVLGNCEQSLGNNSDDCGCGFDESSSCDLLSQTWYRFAQQHVSASARSWLGTRPQNIRFRMNGRTVMVVHGSYSEINTFVFPDTDTALKQRELDAAGVDAIVGGHCGVPFSQRIGDRLWHNAGIIGIPANDGGSNVWFSTFEPVAGAIRVSHRSLEYDFETAARRIRKSDLAHAYADTLISGIWPSDDVMPLKDRQRRGVALKQRVVDW